MPLPNEIDLAYIAGLIDGEGSIGIVKQKDNSGYGLGYYFVCRLTIANTNKQIIEWVKSIFPKGLVEKRFENNPKWKQGFVYCIQNDSAIEILEKVLPYLKIKKKQALIIMTFRELINSRKVCRNRPLSEIEISQRTNLYTEIKNLNKKGVEYASS